MLAAAAAVLAAATPAFAVDIFQIGLPLKVMSIHQDAGGVHVTLGEEGFELLACDTPAGVCLQTAPANSISARVRSRALPDGLVAIAEEGDIRNAWYAQPTDRYRHGVLGDAIEGGSLVAVAADGGKAEFVLPQNQVFEDITPRIRDLDGDGANEIVTIRSSQTGGSAVAVYGLRDGALAELGASSENGQPNRWLNIAGFVGNGAGGATVYAVRTPHIGGQLFSLTYANDRLTESGILATDVSNHVIGSRELGLSAVGDIDGDGKDDLVLLSQDRTRLRFPLSNLPDIALPAAIDKALAILNGRIVMATADGDLLAVKP